MALFGKADADLPILTRFYQVDMSTDFLDDVILPSEYLTENQDIDDYYAMLAVERSDYRKRSELYRFIATEKGIDPDSEDEQPDAFEGHDTHSCYADLWRTIVAVLDALADDSTVPVSLLDHIVDLVQDAPVVGIFFPVDGNYNITSYENRHAWDWYTSKEPDVFGRIAVVDRDVHVPLRLGLLSTDNRGDPEPKRTILADLKALLEGNDRDVVRVQRCIECNNPFIVQRKGQRYCSSRCSNRRFSRNAWRKRHNKRDPLAELDAMGNRRDPLAELDAMGNRRDPLAELDAMDTK